MKWSIPLSCICFAGISTASAQIPNGGFESWVNMGGLLEPSGWLTYNDFPTVGGASVEQGTPGNPGNYHVVITSRPVQGGGIPIQGWISAGTSGTHAGFPYTQRPAMLTGQWQYGIQPSDTAQIQVALSKWNSITSSTDPIALGTIEVTEILSSWQLFQVPLTYFSSDTPDTAYIQIVSSIDFGAPIAGSFMKIDDLAFSGSVGMDDRAATRGPVLFPSPATDVLNVRSDGPGELRIYDVTGRVVLRSLLSASLNVVDITLLAPGLFTYQMLDGKNRIAATGRCMKE